MSRFQGYASSLNQRLWSDYLDAETQRGRRQQAALASETSMKLARGGALQMKLLKLSELRARS